MEQTSHKYVTVAYELFTNNEKGIHELVEKAPEDHPYQFITGMGITLDSFEEKIIHLAEGENFDFTLLSDEAYGPYEDEHVIELGKDVFTVNGHFDQEQVYPGAVLPLINADGNHFDGLVLEIKANTVVIDLNHPLAGKDLHFRGKVVTMREATNDEIQGMINMMSGEGCECGCGKCGEGDCHHDHEGTEHGEGHCCGHHHDHKHGQGHCCCGHHDHE